MSLWSGLGGVAALYCLARGVIDLRHRSMGWGVAGLASGIIMLTIPNPNNAVSMSLPIAGAAR